MKTIAATSIVLGTSILLWGSASDRPHDRPAPSLAESGAAAHVDVPAARDLDNEDLNAVVQDACVRCHSARRMTGNLSLEDFDVSSAAEQAETAERMIRKLRAGMMPPPGARRPGGDTLAVLVETIEEVVDDAWSDSPRPGGRTFQRLN